MANEKNSTATAEKINFQDPKKWHGWTAIFTNYEGRGVLAQVTKLDKGTTESQSLRPDLASAEAWALTELESKRF